MTDQNDTQDSQQDNIQDSGEDAVDIAGEGEPGPRRLLRSRDDRVIAGVAGGLGRYFEVDPVFFRIGFVIATFFGGIGVLAYLAVALFTPAEQAVGAGEGGGGRTPAERWPLWVGVLLVVVALLALPGPFFGPFHWGMGWWWFGGLFWLLLLGGIAFAAYTLLRRREGGGATSAEDERPGNRALRALAIIALATAGLVAALTLAAISAWVTATGNGSIVAIVVIGLGLVLVVAAFLGGARWLIVPALLLALPAGAVAAADISFEAGIGEREYRPLSAAEIPADGYELGIGELGVDLRDLAWRGGQEVDLDVDLAIGHAIVSVPRRVCVETDAHTHAGDLELFGRHSSGVDSELVVHPPSGSAPRLLIDAEIGMGKLTVTDRDPAEVDGERGPFGDRWHGWDDDEDDRPSVQRACAR